MNASSVIEATRPIRTFAGAKFLSAGDRRANLAGLPQGELKNRVGILLSVLVNNGATFIIFDCRGGVDVESLAICNAVDEIILIVESDTTSFQATRDMLDIFRDARVASKVTGFIVNKVFEDPANLARNGTALFRTQFLSAVPFDFDADARFLCGQTPTNRLDIRYPCSARLESGFSKSYSST